MKMVNAKKKSQEQLNTKSVLFVFFITLSMFVCCVYYIFLPISMKYNPTGFIYDPSDKTKIIYKDVDHKILYGLQVIESKQYYFDDETGWMITGSHIEEDGIRYYDENGVMVTGFYILEGNTYYFDKSGKMVTGLQTIQEATYYFDDNGILQKSCFLKGLDGNSQHIFYFDADGKSVTGKHTIDEKDYYFNDDGVLTVDIEYLRKGINKIIKKYDGSISVYYKDLNSNQSLSIKDAVYYPCSIIKLPALMAVYQAIADGTLKQTDTLDYYIDLMIRVSDNEAFNYLMIELGHGDGIKGVNIVTKMARKLGMEDTYLIHGLRPSSNFFTAHGANTSSARDIGIALEVLYNHEIATVELCEEMIEILKNCEDNDKLAQGLANNIEFAHKTGYSGDDFHDGGIVYLSSGDYIITCFTNGTSDYTKVMKAISKFVYKYQTSYLPEDI